MGSLHERNPSLWVDTYGLDRERPPVSGSQRADVVVVGAGITGLVTAALLVESGAKVTVVEAGRLAAGATGYTTAKVTSLHGLKYADLEKGSGPPAASAYATANEAGLAVLGQLVERHDLACEWESASAFTYTTRSDRVSEIEAEVAAAQRAGLKAVLVTAPAETELPFEVAAAVRLEDQAQFHPRRFCLDLASRVESAGATIHENSRVVDVDDGSPCAVQFDAGTIEADWVVLASHLPCLDRGLFFAKCYSERSYAVAWSSDETSEDDRIRGMYITRDDPTRSIRSTESGHIIIGGEGHKVGAESDTQPRYEALESWAQEHFGPGKVTHRWSAQDLRSVDGMPYVGRQLPRSQVLVATGFAKWGMTNGAASAQMMSDLIAGRDNPWAEHFDSTRLGPAITSSSFYKENFDAVGRHLIGDRLRTLRPPSVDTLQPGEGAICEMDGDKVAAFRDDAGHVHAVSPVCTHVGCLVAFNSAERTWDCPCHGSRFTIAGEVIEGPALMNLESKAPPSPEPAASK